MVAGDLRIERADEEHGKRERSENEEHHKRDGQRGAVLS
jgi:hypothetical protein